MLFFKTIQKPLILLVILNYYTNYVGMDLVIRCVNSCQPSYITDDSVSSFVDVHSGVPKGSCLGPLLYDYVNDL